MQSASITLMRSSLTGVNEAILVAKAINRNMRQNLFGSFIYNSIAVLVAAGSLYPFTHLILTPIVASAAMSLSSLTVILNAMRLRSLFSENN
jgi:Cu+-exporting ATPase